MKKLDVVQMENVQGGMSCVLATGIYIVAAGALLAATCCVGWALFGFATAAYGVIDCE